MEQSGAPLPPTEVRCDESAGLDEMSTLERLQLLNRHDHRAADAVAEVLPALATVVDAAAARLRRGGRVHYFGAGTPGRLAVLDAAELLPTFNLDEDVVMAHVAGGPAALTHAVENAEDATGQGIHDADAVTADDVVIGITASGTTPYVRGALQLARERGAVTALITSNPAAPLAGLADHVIAPDTGPEVLTGSTRLKAGTAQKMIINGFSTALMVELGRTWSNLMVSVVATNAKLRNRTLRILAEVTGLDEAANRELLEAADGDLKVAIVSSLTSASTAEARHSLLGHGGSVTSAVADLSSQHTSTVIKGEKQ